MEFAPIEELVREIARGGMVILVDDPGRENEGDFVMAAEKASAEQIRFMAAQGRGLICAPLAPEVADRLKLPQMVDQPTDPEECAFTVPVDARDGTTTGISAFDRALTARLLASPSARQRDFRRPGHLFPLRAEPGGVLTRRGHTEAAVDLARLAGLEPVGVICEVMAEDGTMARLPELRKIAARENLLIGTIADLVEYRESTGETGRPRPRRLNVRELSKATLPTPLGVFDLRVYAGGRDDEIVVLSQGDLSEGEAPLVRVHSACFTGDILGSLRCDCGGQLEMALRKIGEEGCGALIYLPQEGRGIGLAKKVEACRRSPPSSRCALRSSDDEQPGEDRRPRAAGDRSPGASVDRARRRTREPLLPPREEGQARAPLRGDLSRNPSSSLPRDDSLRRAGAFWA
ncbi:MAG: 3,4-dihydroxy-2-butanone-4-phosphate synthase [Planctomycetota bacterium]